MLITGRLLAVMGLVSGMISAGCHDSVVGPANPIVEYYIDAPLCGGTRFTYEFTIDGVVVGTEQLVDKQTSKGYPTTVGVHVIGWNLRGNSTKHDMTVTLRNATVISYRVDLYCS
jgi:hypothetical protein